jgi:hypothetical protein
VGYTTSFSGKVTVTPPLSAAEASFLRRYAHTRHCAHQPGPYTAATPPTQAEIEQYGRQRAELTFSDCPRPGSSCGRNGDSVPGLWCQWVPGGYDSETDTYGIIKWDGGEKFYDYVEWMKFIIQHFFMPGAWALSGTGPAVPGGAATSLDPAGHVLNGVIEWQGEEGSDAGRIVVKDNAVMTQVATRSYGDFNEI